MTRRKDFQKAITYTGQAIAGSVEISYKIDGVRLLYRDGEIVTRNNKVPPGLLIACSDDAITEIKALGDVELYSGKFSDVQGAIARHTPEQNLFTEDDVYSLVDLDRRLRIGDIHTGLDKNSTLVADLLQQALGLGYEGLVLRTYNEDGTTKRWYRVKPEHTADVRITGWFEQHDTDKNPKGQLGGFTTDYGKVTAFTEELRRELWDDPDQYVGRLMEVRYKELYPSKNFRYTVTFSRFRDDKEEESFDTKNI